MESIAALSLASNIIQVVDFSARIISSTHQLYTSNDGKLEEHAVLEAATKNLSELYEDLLRSSKPNAHRDLSASDRQLARLKNESEVVVGDLIEWLQHVQLKAPRRSWRSIYEALTTVLDKKEFKKISKLADRLNKIRKEIDSAILVSLHKSVEEIKEQAICPPAETEEDVKKAEDRHIELLNAVRENHWNHENPTDVAAFSARLSIQTTTDAESRFRNMILARLYFSNMPARAESIPSAHARTFDWLFEHDVPHCDDQRQGDSFVDWLRDTERRIYWITGKPGSGKSTLMKYLYNHNDLQDLLEDWSHGLKVTKAGYYLWNSGTAMQMSYLGLLQALLHSCLREDDELIRVIVPDYEQRLKQYMSFGGGREAFTWSELRSAFNSMIADPSRRFFFLIDGLDEFDGKSQEIIDFVLVAARPNVKICVASRPWIPFEDAFKQQPSLRLEHLTQNDILTYVTDHFEGNPHYERLLDCEPISAKALPTQIVSKASGVFLWVYLVVESLLEGLSNADHMRDLQARLDALPADLKDLFNLILKRLQPQYFKKACESFRLLRARRETPVQQLSRDTLPWAAGPPTLLGLFFADETKECPSLQASCTPLTEKEALLKAEQMRRRLNARCKGLLELPDPYVGDRSTGGNYDHAITYLHRTARDFVESDQYWPLVLETTCHDTYDAEARWANANLWLLKVHPDITKLPECSAQELKARCIDSAVAIQKMTGIVQATYLTEVYRSHQLRSASAKPFSSEMRILDFSESLIDYVIVMLSLLQPQQQKEAAKWLRYEFEGRGMKSEELRKWVNYYDASTSTRWLRRRKPPQFPEYV